MQQQHAIPSATRLAAGQALYLHAEAGTRIIVTGGSLRVVERSAWFGERLLEQASTVCDGEQHVIRQSGWITLQAGRAAEVVCIAPEMKDGAARLHKLAAALVARLRRLPAKRLA
jgi:hypothetical protein